MMCFIIGAAVINLQVWFNLRCSNPHLSHYDWLWVNAGLLGLYSLVFVPVYVLVKSVLG